MSYLAIEKQSAKKCPGFLQASLQIHSTWENRNKRKQEMNEDKMKTTKFNQEVCSICVEYLLEMYNLK